MNKQQFCSLQLTQALDCIWEAMHTGHKLDQMGAPAQTREALSPKYDGRCRTKGGLVYMSECDASQLRYYLDRAQKPGEEKYRERNDKEAKNLKFFLSWREANPDAVWTGERYQQGVVRALPPSSRPKVTDWDDNGAPKQTHADAAGIGADEPDYGDMGGLPF